MKSLYLLTVKWIIALIATVGLSGFASALTLTSNTSTSTNGNFTLSWSGNSASAFSIFENNQYMLTVGGHVGSYTVSGKPDGYHRYRVEGCVSQGCADVTKNNQYVSNTVTVQVNGGGSPYCNLNVKTTQQSLCAYTANEFVNNPFTGFHEFISVNGFKSYQVTGTETVEATALVDAQGNYTVWPSSQMSSSSYSPSVSPLSCTLSNYSQTASHTFYGVWPGDYHTSSYTAFFSAYFSLISSTPNVDTSIDVTIASCGIK